MKRLTLFIIWLPFNLWTIGWYGYYNDNPSWEKTPLWMILVSVIFAFMGIITLVATFIEG